ncbi:mechanosensitive ion channel domain-containing protein [Pseudanabaena galeata UHCC 0370]|uniref:Mechanosensitive ion channel domain-containing protein n=1 Tax=Pseudanabaena galeata UHCC 0370 TaxID=3110310 RepID=A0ABU5TQI2_9CYAN|nr:mechanosensitive ion channel domain-containing protein [Pseudanabaena galeata]MEA5480610.1 mechanosensitive ion channel domain-containing protein [Pseudanabaena galeata UHCC 0370]
MTDAINEIAQVSEMALSNGDRLLQVGLITIAGGVGFVGGAVIISALSFLFSWFTPKFLTEIYSRVVIAFKSVVLTLITLVAMELMLLLIPATEWLSWIEFCLSVGITILSGWLLSRLFRDFFDTKILGITFASNPKVKGESIFLLRYLGDFAIAITLILFFCIKHDINVVGIAASLGIGGIAIAFAAQKTLEQFLGGIVLTLDRPFTVGDYIGLSDGPTGKQGTFGRVESIGLRSTKIRTSGKGTLTIIPNNALTQATIENFSGAKKVMSVMMIAFPQHLSNEEQALIRQIVMDSTIDIFGLDWRSTEVAFGDDNAQISFFILGSNELSMELRRQLLDLAKQQITKQLKNQNISFTLDEPTIYVDAPISI